MMLVSTPVLYSACSGGGRIDMAPDYILNGSSGLSNVWGELTPGVGMGGLGNAIVRSIQKARIGKTIRSPRTPPSKGIWQTLLIASAL